MQGFVDRYGIRMPTAIDETDQIFASFGFSYQPAWAFVDDDGTVETHFGALEPEELQARIDALIET